MQMLVPTIIMAALAIVLFVVARVKGEGRDMQGLLSAAKMTAQVLPLLIFAFIVAGMAEVLLPREALERWVGADSGARGIILGSIAGGLCPGGPYVSMPIAAGFLKAGAGIGTMVAFMTAWSLWAVARLPLEVGIMGWRFAAIRFASTFFVPPLAGWIASAVFGGR